MKVSKVVVVIFIATIAGCVSTQITSVADSSYSKAVNKMFIIANLPDKGWAGSSFFANENEVRNKNNAAFKSTFEKLFSDMKVENYCEILTGLELDDSSLKDKMAAYAPDTIMSIECVSITLRNGTALWDATFNISLFDIQSDKRFWRANLVIPTRDPLMGIPNASGESIAKSIFEIVMKQLKADKLEIFSGITPL